MGGCAVCPAVDLMGAVVMPIAANIAAAVAAFAAIFGGIGIVVRQRHCRAV
jgi:hypothetical protein